MMKLPHLIRERELWREGYTHIVGVDEVGRGCLAGPVTVAAVVLSAGDSQVKGVTDSKLLTSTQREAMIPLIKNSVTGYAYGEAGAEEVETHGIVKAIEMALWRAVDVLPGMDYMLLDGRFSAPFLAKLPVNSECVVQGDSRCYSIAAASVLAKVHRDAKMKALSFDYPAYDWHNNKGYGTAHHRQAIQEKGLTPHHRPYFCSRYT